MKEHTIPFIVQKASELKSGANMPKLKKPARQISESAANLLVEGTSLCSLNMPTSLDIMK